MHSLCYFATKIVPACCIHTVRLCAKKKWKKWRKKKQNRRGVAALSHRTLTSEVPKSPNSSLNWPRYFKDKRGFGGRRRGCCISPGSRAPRLIESGLVDFFPVHLIMEAFFSWSCSINPELCGQGPVTHLWKNLIQRQPRFLPTPTRLVQHCEYGPR